MSFSSAYMSPINGSTLIMGVIYNNNTIEGVGGANVSVTCNHSNEINVAYTISENDGFYHVYFPEGDCSYEDPAIVSASLPNGLTGHGNVTWEEEDFGYLNLDIGVAFVAVVPEFGFFVGMLTILSATVVFFIVRKE